MKKIFLMLLMIISLAAGAQTTKTPVQFGDDTWVNVPLQFPFPFYGKIFTNSFMFSNGVVGFFGVNMQPENSFCCSGVTVNNQLWSGFNYTIMPMQTDLLPVPESKFYIQGDSTYQKYWWENIGEYSNPSNLNTFSVEIRPTGYIGIQYDKINITNQYVTSAIIGDASKGEYTVHYSGQGMTLSSVPNTIIYASTSNLCAADPLSDPSCPGYQEAYFNQQCTINPLYNSGCPGYAQAYFNQQCELNGLYSTQCPNYSVEYAKKTLFEQQGIATAVDIAGTTAKNDPQNTTTTTTNNTTIQPETTSVTSTTSVSPAAVISVVRPPEPLTTTQQVQQTQPAGPPPQQQAQRQQEERKTENQIASKIEKGISGDQQKNDKGKMREAVAKVQKEIAKEAQQAKTIEAQVANQGLVVGSMNFVPGFDAYRNAIIPDTNAMLMARQYAKPVIDNQRAQRRLSGANESKWNQMVDSQYQLGK